MPNKLLEQISIIDTPGILTAARRRLSRGDAPPLLLTPTTVHLRPNIPVEQRHMINDPPENPETLHVFLFKIFCSRLLQLMLQKNRGEELLAPL